MHKIIKPTRLKPNATFGVISPASPVKEERLQKGIRYFESLGYRIVPGKNVRKSSTYLAGSDEERLADLHEMFRRPDIDAIICARGGYGTPRFLENVDYELIRKNPKIFIGYSDLTALQLAIFAKTGLVTFSGPMLAVEFASEKLDSETEAAFWKILTTAQAFGEMSPLTTEKYPVLRHGETTGRLLGGCLALINSSLGTDFLPDFTDAILLVEDVDEAPMRIDRCFAQLRNAGILHRLRGVLCGKFVDSENEEEREGHWLQTTLEDYFQNFAGPVLNKFDYGHLGRKYTLPIGVQARLSSEPARVEIIEPAVSE